MSYKKKIALLIALSTLIRTIIANAIELGNDEVYYWTYALHLQYNYFDHPPLVGLLIKLTTANLALHTELFVRLGAIASAAICTWLIFKIGSFISNERTGWFAALLYTSSLYSSIIVGTFILPDSPQMIFWLWGILLLFKIKYVNEKGKTSTKYWLLFGLVTGLCIMSKVHGVFLWGAVGLYALFIDSKWLLKKEMYLAFLVTLIIISPIAIWNIQNNFITYTYHGNRINLNGGGFNTESFGREIMGSFFYNNPINFVLIWISLFSIKKVKYNKGNIQLLMLIGLPLILVLIGISMLRDTFPHWSGPGYTALILIASLFLDQKKSSLHQSLPKVLKASLILVFTVAVAGIGIIKFYPGTLSTNKGNNLGDGDFTLDMYGWKETGTKIDSLFRADVANGSMPINAPIVVNKWFPAAHIDFYVAAATHRTTYAIGELFDLHHYQWLNKYKPVLNKGDDAYFIMPSNNFNEDNINYYKQRFDSVYAPATIPIYRNKKLCKQVFIYKMKGYKF
ncbi:MAG: glycosyltransferase family 39 protein [Chitinophagaceae bacterium]|nr:glycosyltransferase family 39 protein [Chitinophagaceae bacterium]